MDDIYSGGYDDDPIYYFWQRPKRSGAYGNWPRPKLPAPIIKRPVYGPILNYNSSNYY